MRASVKRGLLFALLLCLSMLLVCCAVPAGADGKESLGQVVSVNGSFNIRIRHIGT